MTTKLLWRASKTDASKPFLTVDDALSEICFRLNAEAQFEDREVHIVEQAGTEAIKPELLINITEEALDSVRAAVTTPALVVLTRDRNLLRMECVAQFHLNTEIENKTLRVTLDRQHLTGNASVDIVVAVVDQAAQSPIEKARLYARKTFKLRAITSTPNIPKKVVTDDDLESIGLDGRTPWHINWRSTDVNKPLSELAELWINETYEVHFRELDIDSPNPSERLITSTITSQIMFELVCGVLCMATEATESSEEDSALASVQRFLSDNSSVAPWIEHIDMRDAEHISKLRALCYQGCDYSLHFARLEIA